ncbi:MAG: MaoC family dehydratase [Gammaproteobacteria bacterium]
MAKIEIDGPHFEDFSIGQQFSAPSVTLTEGHAAMYQAITADRMRLPLDHHLSRQVTGNEAPIAHPHLVINVVNGQTTYPSQHVKGNLFYRGLILRKPVYLGDTLSTSTKIVGLKQNKPKPGRAATGMVALEMTTTDQSDDVVMQYWRCPMIACRDPNAVTGHDSDFTAIGTGITPQEAADLLPTGWDLRPLESEIIGLKPRRLMGGDEVSIVPRDTITSAPELVRLTLNIAYAHTDATKSYLKKRLVYGGHTISLALAQVTRAIPTIITVVGWSGCDHTGPVIEEDLIRTGFKVVDKCNTPVGGELLDLHIESFAGREDVDTNKFKEQKVLDWRLTVWTA